MDLVSIIVPVYNSENFLSKCIDSILNQSYQNLEIILIDDGSTDASGRICDKFSNEDSRIKVVHVRNGGVSRARNIGLDISNGKYICFVDSDDTISEKYVEVLYELCVSQRCDISLCNLNIVRLDGDSRKVKSTRVDGLTGDLTYDYIKLTLLFSSPCVKMLRREIIVNNNIRFKEEMSLGEDQHFCYQYLFYVKSYSFLNEALYNYNKYEAPSLSKIRTLKEFEFAIERLEFEKRLMESKGFKFKDKRLCQHALMTMHHFFKLDNYDNNYSDFKSRMLQLAEVINYNFDAFKLKFKIIACLLSLRLYFFVYCLYYMQYCKEITYNIFRKLK